MTNEQMEAGSAGGIAIARDTIAKMKSKSESAPAFWISPILMGYELILESLNAQIEEALYFHEWQHVWELRVARLHIRRAVILMRESKTWLEL
jgi:hypothetical protein